jgi:hypothetical protein
MTVHPSLSTNPGGLICVLFFFSNGCRFFPFFFLCFPEESSLWCGHLGSLPLATAVSSKFEHIAEALFPDGQDRSIQAEYIALLGSCQFRFLSVSRFTVVSPSFFLFHCCFNFVLSVSLLFHLRSFCFTAVSPSLFLFHCCFTFVLSVSPLFHLRSFCFRSFCFAAVLLLFHLRSFCFTAVSLLFNLRSFCFAAVSLYILFAHLDCLITNFRHSSEQCTKSQIRFVSNPFGPAISWLGNSSLCLCIAPFL